MTHQHPWLRRGWLLSIIAGLLVALTSKLDGYAHGQETSWETARPRIVERQQHIAVHQGRLSVHLQDADVGDVLAAIGQQAGITIFGNPRLGTRVSAQFTGMPLDEGLRRLLRLSSLSSTMIYAHAPTRAMVLTAVYVFEGDTGPAPTPQLAAEPSAEDRRDEGGQSFADALAQLSTPLPPPSQVEEHDGAERFRALLESAQHYAASPGAAEENELARRFREALEQPLQPPGDTSPPDLPQMKY